MANQSINIPPGKQSSLKVQVFDAGNVDITGNGSVSVVSSDPTVASVGQITASQYLVQCLKPGTAQITTTYVNQSGTISEVDTINPPDPPTSITVAYGPAV